MVIPIIILSLISKELHNMYPGNILKIPTLIKESFSFKYNLDVLYKNIDVGMYTNNFINIKSKVDLIPIPLRNVRNITNIL